MSLLSWKSCAALAALLLISAGTATAQVCGDADSSGSVTVTDGVQALRAAAGLSTSCTGNTCDVDGSGSVTVTDGVNVLRKAAGIAITENCGGGDVDAQVEIAAAVVAADLRQPHQARIGRERRGHRARRATTRRASVTIDQETGEIYFDNCDLDGFNYNGFFAVSDTTLDFGITFTDLSTGESESLDGSLTQDVVRGDLREHGLLRSHDQSRDVQRRLRRARGRSAHRQLHRRCAGVQRRRQDRSPTIDSIRLSFDTTDIAVGRGQPRRRRRVAVQLRPRERGADAGPELGTHMRRRVDEKARSKRSPSPSSPRRRRRACAVCGDANGDGRVSVSDGVQTLRGRRRVSAASATTTATSTAAARSR